MLELKAVPSTLRSTLIFIVYLIWGFQVLILSFFLELLKGFDFPGHKEVAATMSLSIIPRVIVYFVGMYLTLLPLYLVVPLVLLPKKVSYPILGLSLLLSFFIVFLV
jgi:hypothetical protein